MASLDYLKNNRMLLFASSLIAGLQLIGHPILINIFGHKGQSETLLLIFLFAGLTIGEIGIHHTKSHRALTGICGFAWLLLSVFYAEAIQLAIISTTVKLGLSLVVLTTFYICGRAITLSVYSEQKFATNYTKINFFTFLLIVTWSLSLYAVQLKGSCLGIAVCLFLLLYWEISQKRVSHSGHDRKSITPTLSAAITTALGLISTGWICLYFYVIQIGVYPRGLEFIIYVILSFFLLTIAAQFTRYQKINRYIDASNAVGIGLFLFIVIIATVFSVSDLEPTHSIIYVYYQLFVKVLSQFDSYPVFLSTLLFIPYFFFAMTIPLQEKQETSTTNHIFFCSLGNVIGLIVFGFLLSDLSLHGHILSLTFLSSVIILITSFNKKSAYVIIALLVSSYFLLGSDIEKEIILLGQNQKLASKEQTLAAQAWKSHHLYPVRSTNERVEHLIRDKGQVAYIKRTKTSAILGLGGYTANLFNHFDLIKGLVAGDFLEKKDRRVLILGLGNRITTQQVLSVAKEKQQEITIDVVDNFRPFWNSKFSEILDNETATSNKHDNLNIIYKDALMHLAEVNEATYDMVIWNLTFPNYSAAAKLYTEEGSQLIANSLKSDGRFVAIYFNNQALDCTVTAAFPHFIAYPRKLVYPNSVMVASKVGTPQGLETNLKGQCDGVDRYNYSNYYELLRLHPEQLPQDEITSDSLDQPTRQSQSAAIINAKVLGQPLIVAKIPLSGKDSSLGLKVKRAATKAVNSLPKWFFVALNNEGSVKRTQSLATQIVHYAKRRQKIVNLELSTDESALPLKYSIHRKTRLLKKLRRQRLSTLLIQLFSKSLANDHKIIAENLRGKSPEQILKIVKDRLPLKVISPLEHSKDPFAGVDNKDSLLYFWHPEVTYPRSAQTCKTTKASELTSEYIAEDLSATLKWIDENDFLGPKLIQTVHRSVFSPILLVPDGHGSYKVWKHSSVDELCGQLNKLKTEDY